MGRKRIINFYEELICQTLCDNEKDTGNQQPLFGITCSCLGPCTIGGTAGAGNPSAAQRRIFGLCPGKRGARGHRKGWSVC